MTARPILFSGPMVRAILDDRKTQTRRVLRLQPGELDKVLQLGDGSWHVTDSQGGHMSPLTIRFAPGDRLYVREAWRTLHKSDCLAPRNLAVDPSKITFEADPEHRNPLWAFGRYRPGMHMPRWVSRLTLVVSDVRVQRLQEITEDDARAEGIADGGCLTCGESEPCGCADPNPDAVDSFANLWNSLNEKRGYGWITNPWVVAITFDAQECNIDQME